VFDARVLSTALAGDVGREALRDLLRPESRLILSQFALGPALSGAQPHFHGNAVNTLLFGMRLWVLFAPHCACFEDRTAIEFFLEIAQGGGGLGSGCPTCAEGEAFWGLQRSGEVLYVPEFWGHATLNLADTVGVAHEFKPHVATAAPLAARRPAIMLRLLRTKHQTQHQT